MITIVFGSAGYNTLGVLRNLQKEKVKTFLLVIKSNQMYATIFSNSVKDYKIVSSGEEGVAFLYENFNDGEKHIIYPTSDIAEYHLDNNYDKLKDKFIFPNACKQSLVTRLMDKSFMTSIAEECGIDVPFSIKYSKGEKLPNNIPFPCIVKPEVSIFGNKADIKICRNFFDLESAVLNSNYTYNFIIQQFIEKDFDILLIGCRFISNGKVFLAGIFKKYRWAGNGEDGSWGIITSDIRKYIDEEKIIKYIEKLNYFGPFSLEFGVQDGIPYFFEINLRNDGTSHYFNCLGLNLPAIWIADCMGVAVDVSSNKAEKDFYFIDEFGDFINIFSSDLSLKKWWHDFRNADVLKYYNKGDIIPFLIMMPRRVGKTIFQILKLILKK